MSTLRNLLHSLSGISRLSLTTIALTAVICFQIINLSFKCGFLLINIILLPSRPLIEFFLRVFMVETACHPLRDHQIALKIGAKGLYLMFQFGN
jgi:hypothetical protein